MDYKIDVKRLRRDLKDYYGTGMVNSSPLAIMQLSRLDLASDMEIIDLARKNCMSIESYILEEY